MYPIQYTVDASGGSGSITINTTFPECAWEVDNQVSWIHTSDISGAGSGILVYTVDSNPSYNERTGNIAINGTPISFIQMPSEPEATVLTNSVSVSEISGEDNSFQYFKINVPENQNDFIAEVTVICISDTMIFLIKIVMITNHLILIMTKLLTLKILRQEITISCCMPMTHFQALLSRQITQWKFLALVLN